jgi:hypothetical protein
MGITHNSQKAIIYPKFYKLMNGKAEHRLPIQWNIIWQEKGQKY